MYRRPRTRTASARKKRASELDIDARPPASSSIRFLQGDVALALPPATAPTALPFPGASG